MASQDLHELLINGDQDRDDQTLEDYSTGSSDGKTQVYFQNLEMNLIKHIRQCDIVLGCVAWLTSEPILRALSHKVGVSIIVQKEDFLRPDIASPNQRKWAKKLRTLYDTLPNKLERLTFAETCIWELSTMRNPTLEAVRCVGNYNAAKSPAFPRSHHKFVLFCDYRENPDEDEHTYERWSIVPRAVWTGSFNFTKTAGLSFENAVVLNDKDIVNAYFQEYSQIVALSEPLDWESQWASPEWRLGT